MTKRIAVMVATAGVIGAALRWAAASQLNDDWALLVVNVGGCAVIGWGTARHDAVQQRLAVRRARLDLRRPITPPSPWLTAGFCGALTSMSVLALQLAKLLEAGRIGAAGAWLGLTLAACSAAVIGGRAVVPSRRGRP